MPAIFGVRAEGLKHLFPSVFIGVYLWLRISSTAWLPPTVCRKLGFVFRALRLPVQEIGSGAHFAPRDENTLIPLQVIVRSARQFHEVVLPKIPDALPDRP